MRELKYYVAATVDGFIARPDGSFDGFFLAEGEHFADLVALFPETFSALLRPALGIDAPNREFDTVLMGRHTYEVGLRAGVTSPYPHLAQYLFSRTLSASPDPAVRLVTGDPLAFVRSLKGAAGKHVWLCGGGELAAALFPEIDELILKLNPVLFGSGIPLFARPVERGRLALADRRVYGNGFQLLRYRLQR